MPSAAHDAGAESISDAPTRTPGRSGSPVTLMMPGERLHQRVVAGLRRERPVAAERADRAVDEPLVPGAQRVGAEPEPLRGARPHRLDEDVRAVDEPQQRLACPSGP